MADQHADHASWSFQIGSPNSRLKFDNPASPGDLRMALVSHMRAQGSEEAQSTGHEASVGVDGGAGYQCASLMAEKTSGESHLSANTTEAESASTSADSECASTSEEEPAEFCWMFTARKRRDLESPGEHRMMGLTAEDLHYAESNYRTQRIALRFAHICDPILATQALHLAIADYPKVGSRLIMYEDVPKFHLASAEIGLMVVAVEARVLMNGCLAEWDHVCQTMSPIKKMGFKADATALFEAFLLVSHNPACGCVLVAGFQHVLGDATSYSLFLRRWSEIYQARLDKKVKDLLQSSKTGNAEGSSESAAAGVAPEAAVPAIEGGDVPQTATAVTRDGGAKDDRQSAEGCSAIGEEHRSACDAHLLLHQLEPLEIPAGVFSKPMPSKRPEMFSDKYRDEGVLLSRRFTFSAQTLHALKASVGTGDNYNRFLTTNDLLMAQCACAMAPSRLAVLRIAQGIAPDSDGPKGAWDADPINSPARIVILADHRGRGIEHGSWGNHSVDISIHISFRLLMSGDVVAVARAIHGAIGHELHKLEHDLALYNFKKKEHVHQPKLFLWNSWARVGHALRAARFGGVEDSLQRVEWLNMQVLDASPGEVIIAISPSHTHGLTVGVASAMPSAREDLDLLSYSPFWSLAVQIPTNQALELPQASLVSD